MGSGFTIPEVGGFWGGDRGAVFDVRRKDDVEIALSGLFAYCFDDDANRMRVELVLHLVESQDAGRLRSNDRRELQQSREEAGWRRGGNPSAGSWGSEEDSAFSSV